MGFYKGNIGLKSRNVLNSHEVVFEVIRLSKVYYNYDEYVESSIHYFFVNNDRKIDVTLVFWVSLQTYVEPVSKY